MSRCIRFFGWLGLGWALFVAVVMFWPGSAFIGFVLLAMYYVRKKPALWAMGTAHWADGRSLKKQLKENRGLLLGRLNGKRGPLLRVSFPHTLVCAPTSMGKGVSFGIPFLLSCRDSIVVNDPKGELYRATAAARHRMGHKVVVLDPFREVTVRGNTFNVFNHIPGDASLIDLLRVVAEAMVIKTPNAKDPHWEISAEFLIFVCCVYVAVFAPADDRNLLTVKEIVASPPLLQAAIADLKASTLFDGLLAQMGSQLEHYKERELSGVLTTAGRYLSFIGSPALLPNLIESDFDPAELRTRKMTVYLVLPAYHIRAQSALLRLWITSMLQAVVKQGASEKKLVWMLLDEAASLGPMNILDDMIQQYRGFGIRSILIYQSLSQLKQCWFDGKDGTVLGNCAQVFFGTQEVATADYISHRLGQATHLIVKSTSDTDGGSYQPQPMQTASRTRNWGRSRNIEQHGRNQLNPDEVLRLGQRWAITFLPSLPPILTYLVRYYEEPGLFRTGFLRSVRQSLRGLARACAFLCLGMFAACSMTVMALEREQPYRSVNHEGQKLDGKGGGRGVPGRSKVARPRADEPARKGR
jgi:type IV secretion system protein VirD4